MSASSVRRTFLLHIGSAVIVMICGLIWRLIPMGLPAFFLNYGGGVLWGAMVLFIVGAVLSENESCWIVPLAAASVALAAELFRLYHLPVLDAFRATLAGALLLGRVFNPWNIVAYWLGITLALPLHMLIRNARKM